jgi:hypothetical protein
MSSLRRQLRVTMPDGVVFDVFTKPFDFDLEASTAKKHGWPTRDENPVGALIFLAWAAARRAGEIPATERYETFREAVEDVEGIADEDVDPTPPVAGAG